MVTSNNQRWQAYPLKVSITSTSKKRVKKISDAKSSPAAPAGKSWGTDATLLASSPTTRVKSDPILLLLDGLRAKQVVTTVETKDGSLVSSKVPDAAVLEARALMRSFFPAGKTYRFRMSATFAMTTNGSGVILGFQSFSPSVSSFNEWTALSALFDEVRGITNQLTMVSSFGGTSTAIVLPIALAPDFRTINTTPSSATAVNRLAESDIIVGGLLTANRPRKKIVRYPSGVGWASVDTPAVASPPAGLIGQWSFAGQIIAGTVSITYMYCFMDNLVQFRCRA